MLHPQVKSQVQSTSKQPASNGIAPARSARALPQKKTAVSIQVNPPALQFGEVYPGISGPLTLSVSGLYGRRVRGTIHTTEPWILIDRVQFDDALTEINVRINSTSLRAATHHIGTILIVSENDGAKEHVVTVEADVQGQLTHNGWRRRGGKTIGADLDEEDDEEEDEDDALIMNNVASVSSGTGRSQILIRQNGAHYANDVHRSAHEEKYGDASSTAGGWEPLQASAQQQLWLQHGFAFIAAMMVGSLCYTLLTSLPPLASVSLLSPSPWFILILVLLVPTTTLGALLINRDDAWDLREKINHACTGMLCSLTLLALVKLIWQLFPQAPFAHLELVVMLVMSSLGAAVGTYSFISEYIIFGTSWLLANLRWLTVTIAALFGGLCGFLLTTSMTLGCFTPFGIVIGAGVAVALVLRVDYLVKIHYS